MGDESFNETILTDKLSKLNSSQQSIESVSRWCISHRKRAKQVVETWEKLFKSAEHQQQVSFLYLSNDILQNSRRKGSEFVNEFWKVLPDALKGVQDGGNENCRKVASRLVGIWEERKVFGSRGQILKKEVLGKNPSPANNVKSSSPIIPIKVVKRDANSLRIKLAVGGLPERILSAMQLVQDEVVNEQEALDKCRDAVSVVREMEKDVGNVSPGASGVNEKIEKQENLIQQCISELEKSEEVRVALVSQLREALQDQESKLEQIRSELHVARGQIEQAARKRLQMTSAASASPAINQQPMVEPTFTPAPPTSTTMSLPLFINSTTEEDSKKATAAAVAAKLAASTSSAQMLTSILSSLVAEEAASMSSGLKRQKLSDPDGGPPPNPAYFSNNAHHVFANNMGPGTNQLQAPFQAPLPPPPPPPSNSSTSQSMGMQQYGYGAMAFARPAGPPPQQAQQQQQQPTSGGYFRPVGGVGFYGQNHQPPTTPPIHRQ